MATQTLIQPYLVSSSIHASANFVGGVENPEFIEVASSGWEQGALLYIDGDGKVAIATNSSQKVNSPVSLQATKAATGTTGAAVHARVIHPTDIYMMNVYHTTAASAVTAQNQLGDIFGIYYVAATEKFHVDLVNTTTEDGTTALAKVQCVGFPRKNVDGVDCDFTDVYGLMLVKFLPFTIASDGSPMTRNLQLS